MSHGRKPPSPYGFNNVRYRKVPKRDKSGGGFCGLVLIALLVAPNAIIVGVGAAIHHIF